MHKHSKPEHSYEQFYMKRLNTESFASPSFKDQIGQLSDKIEHQIKVVRKNMRVKNLKMFRAKEKLKTIQNQQKYIRETLRNKLQQKIRMSQTNLEKLMLTKNTKSKSRQQFRETTISRIKSTQKCLIEQSFRKSQKFSQDSQRYLVNRKQQLSISRISSHNPSPVKDRYNRDERISYGSLVEIDSRKKVIPYMLKVTDRELKEKQLKKNKLQDIKDVKNLHQYIQKLNCIDQRRQTRSLKLAETVKLIERERKKDEQKYYSRKKGESFEERLKDTKSIDMITRNAIKTKYSFSDLYTKRLQQKIAKKAFFQQQSIKDGNKILEKQSKARKNRFQSRLLEDAVKQIQKKTNFKNMEKFRK